MFCLTADFVHLPDLHVMNPAVINAESEGSADGMKTIGAGSARIDDHHAALMVVHHPEDVGMPAHEDVWMKFVYKSPCPRVIPARIASDMNHQHFHAAAVKKPVVRIVKPDILAVAVAVHTFQRLEGRNLLRSLQSAEVSGMPYLIHRLQEILQRGIKQTMGI